MSFKRWWAHHTAKIGGADHIGDLLPGELEAVRKSSSAAFNAATPRWQPIETAPIHKRLLVKSGCGHMYFAKYFPDKMLPATTDLVPMGWGNYDETTGEHWCPAGWYKDVSCDGCDIGFWEVEKHLAPVLWIDMERFS